MPAEFRWSISRHDSLATCPRRYYYAYYAAAEDAEVHRLKKLSALPLWAGSVVHETIEDVLKTREALPGPAEQEAIARAAVHERMLQDWRESEQGSPRFRLFEHEYGVSVDKEDKKLAVATVLRSLRAFFRQATVREVFALGRDHWLSVEELLSFDVAGVPVALRMDLAYRDARGRVVIVDWKTGRAEGRFNAVQLAAYALYASRQGWAGSAEDIETELSYLAVPRAKRRRVAQGEIAHAERFIARSAARMKASLVDPDTNAARLEDFPMIDRPQVCRRCNFRALCFPRTAGAAVPPPRPGREVDSRVSS
jgi:CRISPR/Cas system-associated exonuclease Cas4 (RecB family)